MSPPISYAPRGKDGPRWTYGQPYHYINGRAWKKLHGPCPKCGTATGEYGGAIVCLSDYCQHSANQAWVTGVPRPGPIWWTNGTKVYMDGDMWCAVLPDFINPQESPAGFGKSPQEAVEELWANAAKQPSATNEE